MLCSSASHVCISCSYSRQVFRHEIAFVFGQLLSPHSVPSLVEVLKDSKESDMVRHEAAEALGGIGTPEVLPHLKEWMTRDDSPRVVRESCQVAIDLWEVRLQSFITSNAWPDHEPCSMRIRTNSSTQTPSVGLLPSQSSVRKM